MKKSLYTFSILQYRHDVWIGEAMNVGVLLSSPEKQFLQMKVRTASSRISQAYPGLNASDFRSTVHAMRDGVSSISARLQRGDFWSEFPEAERASSLILIDDDSSLQWMPGGSGITLDPQSELERLFQRYISRWDQPSVRNARTDEDVYSTFQGKLRSANAEITLEEKVIRTKRFGSVKFKHTYQNGALHVIQPLSFDAASADNLFEKAAKWRGNMGRLKGTPNIIPYFITGRPQDPKLLEAYKGALELLKDSNGSPKVVEENESDLVAETLSRARH